MPVYRQIKEPFVTVGSSKADYITNGTADDVVIQAAIDAVNSSGGGIVYIKAGTYNITSTLLFKSSYIEIIGSARGTKLQCDGSSVTTLIKANSTTYKQVGLRNVLLSQTNATVQGIGIDASNVSLAIYENIEVNGFGTAVKLNDTANNTFYNHLKDIKIFSCNNGIDITSTNPVNDNLFDNIRVGLQAGGSGTGLIMTNGQDNVFINLDLEPATGTGITGMSLTTSNTKDNVFIGLYAENNATNVSIGSGVNRTTFIGGTITSPLTTNISDSGTQTAYLNTNDNGAVRNNPGSLSGTLVTNDITVRSGSSLRTATTSGNTLLLSAFNTGGSSYTAFATLTAGATPTMDLSTAVTIGGVAITSASNTQTISNKRITNRVSALSANSATPAINTDTTDVVHITAQTANITSFTSSLTGTPVDGDTLRISVTGTGAVTLTWGTSFESSTVTLPATTITTNRLDIGFLWNTETSKWRCIAVA